jgi:hypothetical protein
MRRDFGAFLRRVSVDRVHASKIWREQAKQVQLPRHPLRPEVRAGAGILGWIGMDQLPDARDEIGRVLRQ